MKFYPATALLTVTVIMNKLPRTDYSIQVQLAPVNYQYKSLANTL